MEILTTSWGQPILKPDMDLPKVTRILETEMRGEFCQAKSFQPDFITRLMREGYLTMAESCWGGDAKYQLTPKLHRHRSVLYFPDAIPQRHARKCASKFELSVDQCFDKVMAGLIEQHGDNWLYPPLRQSLAQIHARPGGMNGVRIHSVEMWQGDALVAGEIGAAVGGVYTSYSGFSKVSSAGTVQCLALALLLQKKGFQFLDFGMQMSYKDALGAQTIPRSRFLGEFRSACAAQDVALTCDRVNTAEIFKWFPTREVPNQKADPNSKRQQKKRARRQRRLEAKAKAKAARADI